MPLILYEFIKYPNSIDTFTGERMSFLGLFLLILLGFGVRLRIKDSFLQSLPSFSYAVLNGYIAIALYLTL